MEAEDTGEDVIGEGLDLEVVFVDGRVEVTTCDVDPVLRAADVRLEVLELLCCFQIGIGLPAQFSLPRYSRVVWLSNDKRRSQL